MYFGTLSLLGPFNVLWSVVALRSVGARGYGRKSKTSPRNARDSRASSNRSTPLGRIDEDSDSEAPADSSEDEALPTRKAARHAFKPWVEDDSQ